MIRRTVPRPEPISRLGRCQTACKPGSVPLSGPQRAVMAIPLGRSSPSASCDRPERRREGSPGILGSLRDACRSYLVLLPVGFSLPPPLPAARCALAAPFHPYRPPGVPGRVGGVLSVALSLGSPPPGVTRHRTSVEPGLSSPRQERRAAIRPSGTRGFGDPRQRCQRYDAALPMKTHRDPRSDRPDQDCVEREGFYNCGQSAQTTEKREGRPCR